MVVRVQLLLNLGGFYFRILWFYKYTTKHKTHLGGESQKYSLHGMVFG